MKIIAENRHEEKMIEAVIAKSRLKADRTLKQGVWVIHDSKNGYDVFERMLCLLFAKKRDIGYKRRS